MEGDITAMVNIVFIDKISIVEFPGRIALKTDRWKFRRFWQFQLDSVINSTKF